MLTQPLALSVQIAMQASIKIRPNSPLVNCAPMVRPIKPLRLLCAILVQLEPSLRSMAPTLLNALAALQVQCKCSLALPSVLSVTQDDSRDQQAVSSVTHVSLDPMRMTLVQSSVLPVHVANTKLLLVPLHVSLVRWALLIHPPDSPLVHHALQEPSPTLLDSSPVPHVHLDIIALHLEPPVATSARLEVRRRRRIPSSVAHAQQAPSLLTMPPSPALSVLLVLISLHLALPLVYHVS
jgi:hypothetical protein